MAMADEFADDRLVELLNELADGKSLLSICKTPGQYSRSRVYQMIEADPEFAGQFRAARAQGVHALADQCLEIADEKAVDAVAVADKRVRIDTRLRLAGKWLPKVYGDKIDVNHTGEVQHRHDLSSYSADELDALEALVAKGADAPGDQGGTIEAKSGSVH